MASPGDQHCANCIGTLSFPILANVLATGRSITPGLELWLTGVKKWAWQNEWIAHESGRERAFSIAAPQRRPLTAISDVTLLNPLLVSCRVHTFLDYLHFIEQLYSSASDREKTNKNQCTIKSKLQLICKIIKI